MNTNTGLRIAETIRIESPQHLSEELTRLSERGTHVLPVGGGACLGTGNVPDHPFHALDLTALTGIDDYIPTDMTASFRAGTSLTEIKQTLAVNGQELPIDIADDDVGTIGGLVATGYTGASRLGKGSLKDGLIGCGYVRGDGLVAKAGGMTVKNVSGFEIPRMLHGSWGSLAVLTRVNLKVTPIPRGDTSLSWHDASIDAALTRHTALMETFPMAIAIETIGGEGDYSTRIRFQGRDIAVEDYVTRATDNLGAADQVQDGAGWWVTHTNSALTPQLWAGGRVSDLLGVMRAVEAAIPSSRVRISLPTGSLRVAIDEERVDPDIIPGLGAPTWMIEGGSAEWKRSINVWGPDRPDASVARAIKQQFDPAGVLNAGRLFV